VSGLTEDELLGGVDHVTRAEFDFDGVAVLSVPDVDYSSFFIPKHLGQKSSPPDMIANFHFDPFLTVAHTSPALSNYGS